MKQWTEAVRSGRPLEAGDVTAVTDALLAAESSDEDKADFLEALHARGESPAEIIAFAEAFLRHAEPFEAPPDLGPLLDVCGTGGDKLGLFNISTAVMFVAAGAGAKLAKHGNRGITSRSGGADVLEALGVPVDLPLERLHGMLEEAGAAFLFAPRFHPAFKSVAPARKLLASRGSASIFNMLGPLLNPARPARQLTGVFSEDLITLYADVLPGLGREHAWIVHGKAGDQGVMDEISTLGPTTIAAVREGRTSHETLTAADWNVAEGVLDDLRGGDAVENAVILEEILAGERRGAARDIVSINAAAAIIVAGLCEDRAEAMERVAESIDSGAARRVLAVMRRVAGVA
ncbi:MAG: anthranilate phosphoribosyltransferase [Chthoniobacterales bacterium]